MYDSIYAAIQERNTPIYYKHLYNKLLNKDLFQHKKPQQETSAISASMAQWFSPTNSTPRNHKRGQPLCVQSSRQQHALPSHTNWRTRTPPQRIIHFAGYVVIRHIVNVCRSFAHNNLEAKANYA